MQRRFRPTLRRILPKRVDFQHGSTDDPFTALPTDVGWNKHVRGEKTKWLPGSLRFTDFATRSKARGKKSQIARVGRQSAEFELVDDLLKNV